jgi:hypothetical protein
MNSRLLYIDGGTDSLLENYEKYVNYISLLGTFSLINVLKNCDEVRPNLNYPILT